MEKSDENNSLPIEYNGNIYRCVRRSESGNDFGKWDFLYNGKWHEVISYPIRSELNNLQYKYEKDMVRNPRSEVFKTGEEGSGDITWR